MAICNDLIIVPPPRLTLNFVDQQFDLFLFYTEYEAKIKKELTPYSTGAVLAHNPGQQMVALAPAARRNSMHHLLYRPARVTGKTGSPE
jgi:hypothetical protein